MHFDIPIICQDLLAAKEKLTHVEVQNQSLSTESDMLRSSEGRLTQEKESLLREQRSRDLLLANLQTIQVRRCTLSSVNVACP